MRFSYHVLKKNLKVKGITVKLMGSKNLCKEEEIILFLVHSFLFSIFKFKHYQLVETELEKLYV